jgi:hypothetical protein
MIRSRIRSTRRSGGGVLGFLILLVLVGLILRGLGLAH